MRISDSQIKQVNSRIDALVAANNFYGKKLKAAGITSISRRSPSPRRATSGTPIRSA